MLEITGLAVNYGSFRAVKDVSLRVERGEFVGLIGSNGAGKTTTVKAVSGLLPIAAGRITFDGQTISGQPSHVVCNLGLIHVPEGRKLFPHMKVIDNLLLGAYLPRAASRKEQNLRYVFELFPRLAERRNQMAGTLSGGEQQMVAIGRALMAEPRMLMLDEPTLGLSPKLAAETLQTVKRLNDRGLTVLVICQEVLQVLQLAHRAYVMENGTTVIEGPAADLMEHADIRQAYLGV